MAGFRTIHIVPPNRDLKIYGLHIRTVFCVTLIETFILHFISLRLVVIVNVVQQTVYEKSTTNPSE